MASLARERGRGDTEATLADKAQETDSGSESEDEILFDTKNAKLLSDSWLFAKERIKSLDVIDESLTLNPNDEKLVKQYVNIAFSAFEWNEVINGIRKAEKIGVEDDGKHDLMIGIAFFETKDLKKLKIHLYKLLKVKNMLIRAEHG